MRTIPVWPDIDVSHQNSANLNASCSTECFELEAFVGADFQHMDPHPLLAILTDTAIAVSSPKNLYFQPVEAKCNHARNENIKNGQKDEWLVNNESVGAHT